VVPPASSEVFDATALTAARMQGGAGGQ